VIVLGIESSCDETSAAIIDEQKVYANIIASQMVHAQFGGVVPELASRAHLRKVAPIVREALRTAGKKMSEIDAVAVTHGPGLVGALLVGLNFAKGLALSRNIPFIGVNHMEGHIYGNLLTHPDARFPILFVIVSGGHTQLVVMRGHLQYEIIGSTRDDAVGEAFDKTAKILGLGYPGGPEIDRLAQQGDPLEIRFPRAFLKDDHYDFSYSGLKTAVRTHIQKLTPEALAKNLPSICASFQFAAIDVLVRKAQRAAREYGAVAIAVAGGVAANSHLRQRLAQSAMESGLEFYKPELAFCSDNAAMIARAGLERLKHGEASDQTLNAFPSLKLASFLPASTVAQ